MSRLSQSFAGKDTGLLVLIVGPSGSGKDTLISWLQKRLGSRPEVLFVKRTVTRKADAASEDHDTLSTQEFAEAEASGAFSVTWSAHGLDYGLPSASLWHVSAGGVAIANGSRRALDQIAAVYPNVLVVKLTVEPNVLRQRLLARGRETPERIEQRLRDVSLPLTTSLPVLELDNSGKIETAGELLVGMLFQQGNVLEPAGER